MNPGSVSSFDQHESFQRNPTPPSSTTSHQPRENRRTAVDFERHGGSIRFLETSRCENCQKGNSKCLVQEADDRCVSCESSGSECIFVRSIALVGPKSAFQWNDFLGQNEQEKSVSIVSMYQVSI